VEVAVGRLTTSLSLSRAVVSDDVSLATSREVVSALSSMFVSIDFDVHVELAEAVLRKTQPRLVSFAEQVRRVREDLATRLESAGRFSDAAEVMEAVDSSSIENAVDKLHLAIKTASMFVKSNALDKAEKYMNKTPAFLAEVPASDQTEALVRHYHTSWAEMLDRLGRFTDAAARHVEIARLERYSNSETLMRAAMCVLLAPQGPQRSRLLHAMYKDERYTELAIFPFLEKVYLDRILRANEVQELRKFFSTHHLEVRADGLSSLQRAMMEHNLVSMRGMYENIGFDQLGELLGVSDVQAEKMVAKLIRDDRLSGRIDQVDRFVYFDKQTDPLVEWDEKVVDVSLRLNDIVEDIRKKALVQD